MPANRKPKAWNLSPQLTAAPELWRDVKFVFPFWSSGNKIEDLARQYSTTASAQGTFLSSVGMAMEFEDSSNDHAELDNSAILGDLESSSLLVLVSIDPNILVESSGRAIYAERNPSNGTPIWKLDSLSSNSSPEEVFFTHRDDAGNLTFIRGSIKINDGGWHVILLTKVGKSVSGYVDGKLDISGTLSGSDTLSSLAAWLAADPQDSSAASDIDIALAIGWSRDLKESDVQLLSADPFAMLRPAGF